MKSEDRATTGLVLHWAIRYDLLLWFLMRGKEQTFRERLLQLAHQHGGLLEHHGY